MSQAASSDVLAPAGRQRPGRVRPAAAALCLLLAALLTAPAGFALWGQRTLIDTQRYASTVGPLIRSSAVQDAIATRVIDVVDTEVASGGATLDKWLSGVFTDARSRQQVLGAFSGAVDGVVASQVRQFIASPEFAVIWEAANVEAQRSFVQILKGDTTGPIALHGSQIVLNLSAVITQVEQRLAAGGLTFVRHLPIPQTDAQIVLADAPHLGQLRTMYAFTSLAGLWLIGVVAVLFVAAFLLARRRPRMAVLIGVALVADAFLAALLVSFGRHLLLDQFAATAFGPASAMFYDTLLAHVQQGRHALLWLGAALVSMGWVTGSAASAAATRRRLSAGLARVGIKRGAPVASDALPVYVPVTAGWSTATLSGGAVYEPARAGGPFGAIDPRTLARTLSTEASRIGRC